VLFLAYMPIVSASLRALDCIEPVAGHRYLRSDLRVECGVGEHAAARALAVAVLVALGIGFPPGLAWLLGTARNDQLADAGFHATWGFLFDGYRAPTRSLAAASATAAGTGGKLAVVQPASGTRGGRRRSSVVPERLTQTWVVSGDSRVWWEAVVLCRKAGVVLLAVTLTNPYLQCVGATLWFLGAFILQVRYSPYTKPLFNRLETASLVTTLLTDIISTALLQYNVGVSSADLHPPDAMADIEWAVTVLLAVLNVGTFVALAGLWLYLQCARARGIVRGASAVTALVGRVARMRAVPVLARGRAPAVTTTPPPRLPPPSSPPPAKHVSASAGGDGSFVTSTANPLRAAVQPHHSALAAVTGVVDDAAVASPVPSAVASRRHVAGAQWHAADDDDAASLTGGAPTSTATHGAALPSRGVAFAATPVDRSRLR